MAIDYVVKGKRASHQVSPSKKRSKPKDRRIKLHSSTLARKTFLLRMLGIRPTSIVFRKISPYLDESVPRTDLHVSSNPTGGYVLIHWEKSLDESWKKNTTHRNRIRDDAIEALNEGFESIAETPVGDLV